MVKNIDPITGQPISEYGYARIEEVVNSAISYVGISANGSDTSKATWQIIRKYTSGNTVKYTYASNSPEHRFVWDNRTTYFPNEPLANIFSLTFNGINECINYGDTFSYDVATAFSMSLWVNVNNLAATRSFFSKTTPDANVYGYALSHNTAGALILQMRSPGGLRTHTFSTATLSAGQWAHLVLTYNGAGNINGARVYINGVVMDTPATGALGGSWLQNQAFTLGCRNNALYYSGLADQFGVWNKALSQLEVDEVYASGNPPILTGLSTAGNLITWAKMGDGDVSPVVADQKGNNAGTMQNMDDTNIVQDAP